MTFGQLKATVAPALDEMASGEAVGGFCSPLLLFAEAPLEEDAGQQDSQSYGKPLRKSAMSNKVASAILTYCSLRDFGKNG